MIDLLKSLIRAGKLAIFIEIISKLKILVLLFASLAFKSSVNGKKL